MQKNDRVSVSPAEKILFLLRTMIALLKMLFECSLLYAFADHFSTNVQLMFHFFKCPDNNVFCSSTHKYPSFLLLLAFCIFILPLYLLKIKGIFFINLSYRSSLFALLLYYFAKSRWRTISLLYIYSLSGLALPIAISGTSLS